MSEIWFFNCANLCDFSSIVEITMTTATPTMLWSGLWCWLGDLPLLWRHNGQDSASNHQPHHCLLSRLFRRRSKKTSKLRVTGLCAGNSPGTGEFPAQMASYAENVSILMTPSCFARVTACAGTRSNLKWLALPPQSMCGNNNLKNVNRTGNIM